MVGRVVFGLLSDRFFGGRRRIVLVLAGVGSTACSLVIAATGPDTSPWLLAVLAARLRLRRHRLERRAAHADGRARRAALGGNGGRARTRGVLLRRHRLPAALRRPRGVGGRLDRALDHARRRRWHLASACSSRSGKEEWTCHERQRRLRAPRLPCDGPLLRLGRPRRRLRHHLHVHRHALHPRCLPQADRGRHGLEPLEHQQRRAPQLDRDGAGRRRRGVRLRPDRHPRRRAGGQRPPGAGARAVEPGHRALAALPHLRHPRGGRGERLLRAPHRARDQVVRGPARAGRRGGVRRQRRRHPPPFAVDALAGERARLAHRVPRAGRSRVADRDPLRLAPARRADGAPSRRGRRSGGTTRRWARSAPGRSGRSRSPTSAAARRTRGRSSTW